MSLFQRIKDAPQIWIQNRIEKNLKKALLQKDLSRACFWLKTLKPNDPLPEPLELLHFRFKNGENLSTYLLNQSNQAITYYRKPESSPWYLKLAISLKLTNPKKLFLFPAQNYVKNLLLLKSALSKPAPSVFARILPWLSKKMNLSFDFTSEKPAVREEVLKKLKIAVVEVENIENANDFIEARANAPTSEDNLNGEEISIKEKPLDEMLHLATIERNLGIFTGPQQPPVKDQSLNRTEEIAKAPVSTLPEHLQHFLGTTKINQVFMLEEVQQQQQQQVNQQVNQQTLANCFAQVQQQNTVEYQDNSPQEDIALIANPVHAADHFFHRLKFELTRKNNNNDTFPLKITEDAHQILKNGTFNFSSVQDLDLDKLPLGFFIERQKQSYQTSYILKYNPELRLKQLEDRATGIRLDPGYTAAIQEQIMDIEQAPQITELELTQQLLAKMQADPLLKENLPILENFIAMAKKHQSPTDHPNQSEAKIKRYQTIMPALYQQLDQVISKTTPKHFLAILNALRKLNEIPSMQYKRYAYQNDFKAKPCTVLDNILGAYFGNTHTNSDLIGQELSDPNTLRILNNLAEERNEIARQLFVALINSENPLPIQQAWNMALQGQTHFKTLQITRKINIEMETILESIAHSGPQVLQTIVNLSSAAVNTELQIKLICAGQTPKFNTVFCDRLLNQGYSFVAECMDLDKRADYVKMGSKLKESNINIIVTDGDLSKLTEQLETGKKELFNTEISPQKPYFTAWFRYLAYQVAPEEVEKAVEHWQKIMGTDSLVIDENHKKRDYKNLKKHWKGLVDYLQALPKKGQQSTFEKINAKNFGYATQDNNYGLLNEKAKTDATQNPYKALQYDTQDAQALFEVLNFTEKEKKFIYDAISVLNENIALYATMPQKDLLKQLQTHSKQLCTPDVEGGENALDEKTKQNLQLSMLAMVRELNYRLTSAKSKSNPPKGEWMRLEQTMVVLLSLGHASKLFQIDTSEGKTLMIGVSAIMHALQGQKVDIYTHNELFAEEAVNKIQFLGTAAGLSIADKHTPIENQLEAHIVCKDISTAVMNHAYNRYKGQENRLPDVVLADEIDNHIDIQAQTTMQISASQNPIEGFERFLINLAEAYNELKKNPQIRDEDAQLEFIKTKLLIQPEALFSNSSQKTLKYWVSAMVNADSKKVKEDFVREDNHIRIVHHNTTGRVDKQSIWGEGVHQCRAALDRVNKEGDMIIPPLSQVAAEGSVDSYYRILRENNTKFIGETGSFGEEAFTQSMGKMVGVSSENMHFMPRAKRAAASTFNWPLMAKENEQPKPKYNRNYSFAPRICEDAASHSATLYEMILRFQQKKESAILFFNTIAECEAFNHYLEEAGIENVQIFDDTAASEDNSLKKTQNAAILHASNPGMITLTTVAGSRGTDFYNVSAAVVTAPATERVAIQQKGRVGRNGTFAVNYQIYHKDQLHTDTIENNVNSEDTEQTIYHINPVHGTQKNIENTTLLQLEQRKPLDEFKNDVQNEYAEIRKGCSDRNRLASLESRWLAFFSNIEPGNIDNSKKTWDQLKNAMSEEINKENKETFQTFKEKITGIKDSSRPPVADQVTHTL